MGILCHCLVAAFLNTYFHIHTTDMSLFQYLCTVDTVSASALLLFFHFTATMLLALSVKARTHLHLLYFKIRVR